jgi:ligand-binding sensor domain-containing protein
MWILGGLVALIALVWLGWRAVEWGDEAIDRWTGPGIEVEPTSPPAIAPAPPTDLPSPVFTMSTFGVGDGLPVGDLAHLAIGPDGSVWVTADLRGRIRVAAHTNDEWTIHDTGLEEVEGTPRWLAAATDGTMWMAVEVPDGGEVLAGYDGETWGLEAKVHLWGTVIREGAEGQLWIAGLDEQLRPIRLDRVTDHWETTRAGTNLVVDGAETATELDSTQLAMRVAVGGEGTAWYAGDETIVRFDGRHVTSTQSATRPWVAIGPDGGVWTPTDHGLRRYRDGAWAYYDARHGLPGTTPIRGAIRFGPDGVWALFRSGFSSVGYVFNGSSWQEASAPSGSGLEFIPQGAARFSYTPVAGTIADLDDVLWARSGSEWVPVRNGDGVPLTDVTAVVRDPTGTLWVIAENRLVSVRMDNA